MRSNTRLYAVLLILLVAGFSYGAIKLMLMRYAGGDIYPPYSTYRADPLGAKAFYESLQSMPDRSVRRNVDPLRSVAGNRRITLYLNGLTFPVSGGYPIDSHDLDSSLAGDLDRVLLRGGRVVVSFAPIAYDFTARMERDEEFQRRMDRRFGRKRDEEKKQKDEPKPDPTEVTPAPDRPTEQDKETVLSEPDAKPSEPEQDDEKKEDLPPRPSAFNIESSFVSWRDNWEVELAFDPLKSKGNDTYEPVIAQRVADVDMPQSLEVHSSLYFKPASDDWNVLYASGDRAVVIERSVGEGSLVLIADAYPFSNEAMLKARNPALLVWTAGSNSEIVFDEVTMGVQRTQGLAALMSRYRMQGILAALIVIAILYIWKNGQPLAPPYEDTLPPDAYAYEGKDSASGFVNLLRRSVPKDRVLRTCIAEFERAFAHRNADFASTLRDAKAIAFREEQLDPKFRDIPKAYREICALFAKHRMG